MCYNIGKTVTSSNCNRMENRWIQYFYPIFTWINLQKLSGPLILSSLNSAHGQKVLYDSSAINEILHNCTKFSVNRVLFSTNPGPLHETKQTQVNLSFEDNEIRAGRFALQAGNLAFKISLSGGNFVAIKAAKYWIENNVNGEAKAQQEAKAKAAESAVASQLVAARGLLQLSEKPIFAENSAEFKRKAKEISSNDQAAQTIIDFSQQGVVFDENVMQAARQLVSGKQSNGGGRKRSQKGGAVSLENVFKMANKLSDLDLKFVCIDPIIVKEAAKIHGQGDSGFGLCRIKVNEGEFIDLSIPIFSRNPILALIIHNSSSDMAKTIAELAYIVSMNSIEPKAETRMIRLDFLKGIDPASKAAAMSLLEDAFKETRDEVIPVAVGIINSDEEPTQLLEQLPAAAALLAARAASVPPADGSGSVGGKRKEKKKKENQKEENQ